MLTKKQIEEIRGHLNSSQNPLFLFDNDQDGLCSFLLLQKYLGRGKGFPVKSSPSLTQDYFRKVEEFNADYIFVLDMLKILTAVGFGYFAGRYYELSKSKVHKHTQRGKNE